MLAATVCARSCALSRAVPSATPARADLVDGPVAATDRAHADRDRGADDDADRGVELLRHVRRRAAARRREGDAHGAVIDPRILNSDAVYFPRGQAERANLG